MLLDMALKDSSKTIDVNKNMLSTVKLARKHRDEAEQLARMYKHAEAIKKLETSSLKIINVIRNVGVYIPN